mgnify:CR=1 FL=1
MTAMLADAHSGDDLLAYDDPVVGRARTAAVWSVASCTYGASNEIRTLAAEAPKIIDFLVDVLRAYEAMESPSSASVCGVYHSTLLLSTLLDYIPSTEAGSAIEMLRDEASALRFVLDNPVTALTQMGLTTNLTMVSEYVVMTSRSSPRVAGVGRAPYLVGFGCCGRSRSLQSSSGDWRTVCLSLNNTRLTTCLHGRWGNLRGRTCR